MVSFHLIFCLHLILRSQFFDVVIQINLLQPIEYVMHQQFNTQQLYAMPTLYWYVSYLSEYKQRLLPLTA